MTQKRQYWIAIPLSFIVLIGLFMQRPSTIVFAGFTPTPTNTPVPPTVTPVPTDTAVPTNTPVNTNTPPPGSTNTPTPIGTPPVVGTPDPASSPTPSGSTDSVSTPSAIPALGAGPRNSDLLMIGSGLLFAMGLLAFGWWKVWQAYSQKNG